MLFMGIGAVSVDQGLMNDSVPEILIDRALRRMARSVVVLADSSKFGQVAPGFVFGLEEVDIIVTDDAVTPATLEAIRRRSSVQVIVAPTEPVRPTRPARPTRSTRSTGRPTRRPEVARDRGHRSPRDPRGAGRDPGHPGALAPAGRRGRGRAPCRGRPTRLRDRQRHELPLLPRRRGPVPPARRAGRSGRDPAHRRRVPGLSSVARRAGRRRRDLLVRGVPGRRRGRPRSCGGGRPWSASSTCPGSTLTRVASRTVLSAGGPSTVPGDDQDLLVHARRHGARAAGAARRGPRSARRGRDRPRGRRRRGGDRGRGAAGPGARRAPRRPGAPVRRGRRAAPTRPRSRPRSSSRRWPSSTPRARRPGR